MHRARILTAIFLLPLLVYLILYAPAFLIWALVLVCAEIGWYEYARLTRLPPDLFMAGVFGLSFLLFSLWWAKGFFLLALWLYLLLLVIYFLWRFSGYEFVVLFGLALAGVVYVGLSFGHLFLVYAHSEGKHWLLVLLAIVFGTDTGAYYTGRALGRYPMAPRISPKKTWEGAVGGTIVGAALGFFLARFLGLSVTWALLLFFVFISIVGQMGDLLESMIKRACRAKDSGKLLPGHGGLLDRVDALIFAAPAFYWGLVLLGF